MVAAAAIIASTALPPSRRIANARCAASACGAVATPRTARTGFGPSVNIGINHHFAHRPIRAPYSFREYCGDHDPAIPLLSGGTGDRRTAAYERLRHFHKRRAFDCV